MKTQKLTWRELNHTLGTKTEAEVLDMLNEERANLRRIVVLERLHRSGQRHDVWVYVLLTEDTVDEKIYVALHDKRSLSDLAMEALK